ncbi:hypothetical protein KVT40_009184 [Elsinoe batatas]|uniref:DUF6594 domain-containing protein n=1 Tax=Elsinoe batatas TaxID=2601811 RepID=A0A8K0PEH3_9PEZI|nr:hypothetical protein KVT40_009184 [Elsinoe batatas]
MSSPIQYSPGFCEYAKFMSTEPELAVFPRFNDVSVRNLVHLMEQVRELQLQLERFDSEEKELLKNAMGREKMGIQGVNQSWAAFLHGAKHSERLQKKLKAAVELEDVLERYQRALISHSAVMRLPPPQQHVAKVCQTWITQQEPMEDNAHLTCDRKDLVSLYTASHEEDLLSRIVQSLCGWYYRDKRVVPPTWDEIPIYDDEKTQRITSFFTVFIAVIMLFGATAILTFAKNVTPVQRMAIIGAFTATFASLVGVFTNCKRSELFVAVSTYSAVLVVFAEVTNKAASM